MTILRDVLQPVLRPVLGGLFTDEGQPTLDFDFEHTSPSGLTNTGADANRWYTTGAGVMTLVTSAAQIRDSHHEWNAARGLWESVGLLRENTETNLMFPASDFLTTWAPARASVVDDAVLSADGISLADKLVEDTTLANTHYVNRSDVVGTADNDQCIMSVNFKPAERNWGVLLCADRANVIKSIYFDSATGLYGTSTGAGTVGLPAEKLTNGWWRAHMLFDLGAGANGPDYQIRLAAGDGQQSYDGDGVSGLYIDKCKVVIGTSLEYFTTHIETTGAAVTRNADTITFPKDFRGYRPFGEWEANYRAKTDGASQANVGYILNGIDSGLNAWAWRMQDTGADLQPRGVVGNGAVVAEVDAGIAQTPDVDNLATFIFGPDSAQMELNGTAGTPSATGYIDGDDFTEFEIGKDADITMKRLTYFNE